MNHRKKGRKFSRTSSHRKQMFQNMSCSLIEHKKVVTTLAKAKELRGFFEPLLTSAKAAKKEGINQSNFRHLFNHLRSKEAVHEVVNILAEKNADRPRGHLRILKQGFRSGDNAPMALVLFSEESIYTETEQ